MKVDYEKISRIKKKIEEIQSQLTESEYMEILGELEPGVFGFLTKPN